MRNLTNDELEQVGGGADKPFRTRTSRSSSSSRASSSVTVGGGRYSFENSVTVDGKTTTKSGSGKGRFSDTLGSRRGGAFARTRGRSGG